MELFYPQRRIQKMKDKENKLFETSYPDHYRHSLTICVIVCIVLLLGVEFIYGFGENRAIAVLLILLGVIIFLLRQGITRYKVIIDNESIIIKPLVGKKRTIALSDIDEVKEGIGGLSIISKNKKIVAIDKAITDYEVVKELLDRRK